MKYTILGFNQKKLIEHKLDTVDALILRYFIDFKDSGNMCLEIIDNKPFYWVRYDTLLEEIPIAKIKNKDVLRRRLKKMEDEGILVYYQKKQGGNFSFYSVGPNYFELIQEPTQKSEGAYLKVGRVPTQKSEGAYSKVGTKDSSIKDSSIKDSSIKDIISYLNKKANTNYRATTKKTKDLITARVNEGFKVQDFYIVIDKKTSEWLGTSMEKYLRPETIFGNKFEGYLNQKGGGNKNGGNSKNNECIKTKGEGELLAERAVEKYGGELDDIECDF